MPDEEIKLPYGGITDTVRIYEDELKKNTKEQVYKIVKLRCELTQQSIIDLVDVWYEGEK